MHHEVDITKLRLAWEKTRDAQAGDAYGTALELSGRLQEAAQIFTELIELGYVAGYYQLAWLETSRGQVELGQSLLEHFLATDVDEDDFKHHVAGVLGHWRWHYDNRADAESLLKQGADYYPAARAGLAKLLRITGRDHEAETVLLTGVAAAEVDSYLPLANLMDETGRSLEAEKLYREGYALGDAYCAYNLHLLLERDYRPQEAAEWLWRAAEAGDELAIAQLLKALP